MDVMTQSVWPPEQLDSKWYIYGDAKVMGIKSGLMGYVAIKPIQDVLNVHIDLELKKGFIKYLTLTYREEYFFANGRIEAISCHFRPRIHIPLIPIEIAEKVEVKTLHGKRFFRMPRTINSAEEASHLDWSSAEATDPPLGLFFLLPHIENNDISGLGRYRVQNEDGKYSVRKDQMTVSYDGKDYKITGEHKYGSLEMRLEKA